MKFEKQSLAHQLSSEYIGCRKFNKIKKYPSSKFAQMAALFWLILAQALVLVLANTTDTNNDTLLVEYDDDHDDYSLIPEEDTETSTSGDYFEDLIIAQLDSVDQTYDPFPIILTFNKPVIINIFLIFYCFKVPQDLDKARQIAFARVFQNWQVSSCNDEVISSVNHSVESQITPLVIDSVKSDCI